MRRLVQSVAGCLVLLVPAGTTRAQTAQPFSLQASGLFVIPGGSAGTDVKSGPGFELQLRRNISEFSIGGGVQYSSHDVGAAQPLSLVGVFLEPRLVLPLSSVQFTPYGSARLALFRQSLSSEGVSATATGQQANVGGGVLIFISRSMSADLGVTLGYLKFGALHVTFAEGGGFSSASSSGTNVVLRAGLAIGLGSTK